MRDRCAALKLKNQYHWVILAKTIRSINSSSNAELSGVSYSSQRIAAVTRPSHCLPMKHPVTIYKALAIMRRSGRLQLSPLDRAGIALEVHRRVPAALSEKNSSVPTVHPRVPTAPRARTVAAHPTVACRCCGETPAAAVTEVIESLCVSRGHRGGTS